MSTSPDMATMLCEDEGHVILGATLAVSMVALATTILRMYVRMFMARNVGPDDYVMCLTMLVTLVFQAIVIPEVYHGAGQHQYCLTSEQLWTGLKLNFITQPLSLWTIALVKISVGLFLLRIATQPVYRRIIWGVIGFMIVYTTVCFFEVMFQCQNPRTLWDPTVHSKCLAPTTLRGLSYMNTSLNIFTDLLFSVFLPIPMLINIHLNARAKSSVICILGLGIFAAAAGIVKATYIQDYGKTGDFLWDSRNITIWTMVETCVGIVAANLPCFKPLFRRALQLSGYGSGSRGGRAAGYVQHGGAYAHGSENQRSGNRLSGYGPGKPATRSQGTGTTEEETFGKTGDEIHMMTRIRGNVSASDRSDRGSEESLGALKGQQGIMKTVATRISYADAERSTMTPEVKVDDRVEVRQGFMSAYGVSK